MNKFLLVVLFSPFLYSQSLLQGKVISDTNPDGIMIVNYTTKATAITQNGGFFSIDAKINDRLVVTSKNIEGVEIQLDSYSFKKEMLYIRVQSKITELEEVKIKSITAKSLGLIDKNYKEMTVNERKLQNLNYNPVELLASIISGERRAIKTGIEVEKKQKNIQRLQVLFPEEYYLETLKISKDALFGFLVYCMDDSQVNWNLKNKNKSFLKLRLTELAFKFKDMKNE